MNLLLRALWRCSLMLLLTGQLQAQSLVHYWNFNNSADESALLTPTLSLTGGASIAHVPGGISAIQATAIPGQGFDTANPNARNGDPAATHLRFNDPIGGALVFTLPTRLPAGCDKVCHTPVWLRCRNTKNRILRKWY